MVFSINFNEEKNQLLGATRGITFEEIIDSIQAGGLLADLAHFNERRPNQRVYVVKIEGYAYTVPYVINTQKKEIFLKTIYPSRALTRKYLQEGDNND